ncbi:MAG TPA: hypothetical protein PLZ99_01410 [Parcubacteria group bacterium]|nr:hypothetical protein [Parcubacteria group bacterium]
MKSPEYVTHGTSSEADAEKIQQEGFEAQEGRATVSGDLIYAFEWATKQERRKGSKSGTETEEDEKGRMVIMKVPEDKSVDYATHTDIEVDDSAKEVTGYTSKYESGRRQLAIYDEGDVVKKREKIEKAKQDLKEIDARMSNFFGESGIDSGRVKSKQDLVEAIKTFDIEKKIEILKKAEELERERAEMRRQAEPDVQISQENILMSVVPTPELGEKLNELSQKIRSLEKVDLMAFTEEISKIIEDNKENFLSSGLDVREVVGNLLSSTMETEVVNMVRSLSLDIKRANGYEIYNRGKDEIKEKSVDKEQLKQKLEKIIDIVARDDFDIGADNLNRYIRINAKKLLGELSGVQPEEQEVEESVFEASSKVGEAYTHYIDKLTGKDVSIEDEQLTETGLEDFVKAGKNFFQVQSERFRKGSGGPQALLKQLFPDGVLPQEFSDSSKYELSEPTEGVFVLKIDRDLLLKVRPDATAVAVKIKDGISFVMVPVIGETEIDERLWKENIPHEVHHLFWKGVMDSGILQQKETDPDFQKGFAMYQDELIARMCSDGYLSGYTHLDMLNPEKKESFKKDNPEKFEKINNIVIELNDFFRELNEDLQIRDIKSESLIGLVAKSQSFEELKTALQEYKDFILTQPITNPRKPSVSGWDFV